MPRFAMPRSRARDKPQSSHKCAWSWHMHRMNKKSRETGRQAAEADSLVLREEDEGKAGASTCTSILYLPLLPFSSHAPFRLGERLSKL
jgi:hypothetical protein